MRKKKKCKYEKQTRICKCGNEFVVPTNSEQKYCCHDCFIEYHFRKTRSDRVEERECKCGEKFIVSKTSKRKFCSLSCIEYKKACGHAGIYRIEREKRKCACGKTFEVIRSSLHKTCSKKCRYQYYKKTPNRKTKGKQFAKRIKIYCLNCNKEMAVTEAVIKRNDHPKFCSSKCYGEGMAKGIVRPNMGEQISTTLKRKYKTGELVSKCTGRTYADLFGNAAEEHLKKVLFNNSKLGIKTSTWEQKILDLNIPGVEYTGDRKFWISYNGRYKNPDFVIKPFSKTKKVIEVLGRYWHPDEEIKELKEYYTSHGINYLFLYDEDFKKDNKYIVKVKEYATT
jgi:hypothetical protein